ncbi:hypothetical protein ACIPZC_25200 [Pseudomonas sp. NPDC089743]|uniref:hypothetical protein n=1 Tax=Pseudomonas sp. NPDC089743 TaxID=3364471 RepID=UPI003808F977
MKSVSDHPLSPQQEMVTALKAVADGLADESDRGTVVLAAAWLDESLTAILTSYMAPVQKKDDLLAPGRALGDFGTKILLAERLRLVHPSLLRSLDMIRKLRNDFAHIASDLNFETQSVKARINNFFQENTDLIQIMGESLAAGGLIIGEGKAITKEHMLSHLSTKKLFGYLCAWLNAALALVKFHLKPAEPQFDLKKPAP